MLRTLALGLAGALLTLAAGYDAMSRGLPADTHEAGRAVYNFRCYFCHGYAGDAKTLAATYLAPKPRDFTQAAGLSRERVAAVLHAGRPGTAMKSYAGTLSEAEIDAVAGFVVREFVQAKAPNTAYHTAANGWPRHERYAVAYPYARGELALDAEPQDDAQREGRALFLSACVSCHDRARVDDEGPAWAARPVSYPRPAGFVPGGLPVDAVSSASVYARHDIAPHIAGLDARQRRGEALFQANCAFCHGADGTGKNWIGQFMEPKARDLTQLSVTALPPARLKQRIAEGLEGTSMPAWRHVLAPAEIDAVAAYVQRAFLRREGG